MNWKNVDKEEDLSQGQLLEIANQNRIINKKIISYSGLCLSIMAIVIFLVQTGVDYLSYMYFREFYKSSWYTITVVAIGVAGVGLPLFALLMKRLPNSDRGEVKRISFAKFIMIFFICAAAMYISNFITVIINFIIGGIRGELIGNPVEELVVNSNMWLNILYVSILGPLVEEIIFRKILLDKVKRFGDLPAILFTGIAFGLFHMNLSQFFYATVLGVIFAYITIRTNTVLYSVILHMMVNFMGGAMPLLLLLLDGDFTGLGILVLWVLVAMTIGGVFIVINIKKVKLNKPRVPLLKVWDYILNPGSLLFLFICIGMIGLSLL